MSQKMFDNDLAAIQKSKVTLTLNKPVYVGMRVLDFSKVLMYEFHYDYVKNKCCNISKLLSTEADSLMHEIKSEDVHDDFNRNKETFHFSNYSRNLKY